MHELSMAKNILEIVGQHVPKGEERTVESVRLEIGELAGVMPEALAFSFEALIDATAFKGTTLVITRIPITGCCHRCGTTFSMTIGQFVCTSCKSYDVTVVGGTELRVAEINLRETKEVPT